MPRAIRDMQDVPLNPFEAMKRYYIDHGYIPRYFRKSAELKPVDEAEKIEQRPESRTPPPGKITEHESQLIEKQEKERAKQELNDQSDRHFPAEPEKSSEKYEAAKAPDTGRKKQLEKELEAEKHKIDEMLKKVKSGDSTESDSEEMANKESKSEKRMESGMERNPMLSVANVEGTPKGGLSRRRRGEHQINEVKTQTEDILYEAETVFPFTLFPDTVKVDREKLTLAKRDFFRTATITSVPISEIMSIEANVGPFFGSIHLILRFFNDNERNIRFFWRQDAINLQRLIHGFIIAHHKGIDLSKVPSKELRETLTQIGQGVQD